jgi:hypothetical protein
VLALTIAAAHLGGLLAAQAHAGAVAHVVCAEHGRPVHLDPASSPPRTVALPGTGPRVALAQVVVPDDHCPIAGPAGPGAEQRSAVPAVRRAPARRVSPPHPAPVDPVTQAALLILAPKTSPPVDEP